MSTPITDALRKAESALEAAYDDMDPMLTSDINPAVRAEVREALDAVTAALPIAVGMFEDPWPNWPTKRSLQLSRVIAELTHAMGKYPRDADSMGIAMAKAAGALSRIAMDDRS